ncbi:hypothetical protein MPH_05985 [Macrophomina phaseolina MS6]|uniref:Uncharacterized protein n=1 Tax=Macrophomina phaseolina (strain MS6) TaxID=1126212 RepID=K2RVN4_MACPH|nr:hypothetical protein MPH_05985 [Macrophomina phaseolina MS6]
MEVSHLTCVDHADMSITGCYRAPETPTLYTPFHHFKVGDKDIFQPVSISKEDYLAGARGPRLSLERSVPMCAHFPITGIGAYNVPFVKGRIVHRMPNSQCVVSRVQDQARMLCLIEDEVRYDGTARRRMNIHAPPADWNDGAAISALNRWRAQFRQRKLRITSRPARYKWSEDALNYIVERLARDPSVYRALLARDVSHRFEIERTEHAVSCAIDHHKLRLSAEALRSRWENEGLHDNCSDGEDDLDVEDFEDFEHDVKDEEILSSDFDREEALRKVKMENWTL